MQHIQAPDNGMQRTALRATADAGRQAVEEYPRNRPLNQEVCDDRCFFYLGCCG